MDFDSRSSRISVALHTVAGFFSGWFSFHIAQFYGNLVSIAVGVLILIMIGYITEFIVKKKGISWWMGNGGILYLFFWFISWVFFLNL
ncbi:MAG: hypothetical protein DRP15_01675 [Candidatus Aenigmatarchaeota archaeon]|nr:MAG: hypothetical protein DRP15_01675 [Candidatus Aenigmarchaeota archaeon]